MDMPAEKPRLLTQVKGRMRARHLSPRTVQAYVGWIIRYIRYHGTRHPSELGETEIVAYLTYLAAERRVSRSTQMQALSALLLLYREVLAIPMGDLRRVLRSNAPPQLPAVLSREEVRMLLGRLSGTMGLIGLLRYGAGLWLMPDTVGEGHRPCGRGDPRAPRLRGEGPRKDVASARPRRAGGALGARADAARARPCAR